MKCLLAAACFIPAAWAPQALAFCVHNDLKDRTVLLTQEEHPDWKRNDNRFKKTIAPGASACCEFKNMDCNPNGRQNSLVGLEVVVDDGGGKLLKCGPVGTPEKGRQVKVSGDGTLRIVPNPKMDKGSTAPYVARVWTHDKQDVTGPSGLPCR